MKLSRVSICGVCIRISGLFPYNIRIPIQYMIVISPHVYVVHVISAFIETYFWTTIRSKMLKEIYSQKACSRLRLGPRLQSIKH